MKKIFVIIAALLVFALSSMPVYALSEATMVNDTADLFTDAQEKSLVNQISSIIEEYGCDVGIYTAEFFGQNLSSRDAMNYAEEYYNASGFSDDGILIMIFFDDQGGGWHIATAGKCIDIFTDEDLDWMEENFLPYLSSGNYFSAAESFTEDCEYEINDYYTFDAMWFLIAPIVGIVIAAIIVNAMESELKTVRSKPNASDYTKQGSMKIIRSSDMFLYRTLSRTPKPKSSSGGSSHTGAGGRSFGGSGGRF